MFDFEHSIDEDRYIAIGKVGEILFVVFTERTFKSAVVQQNRKKKLKVCIYFVVPLT